ncbi:class I SAM-dependent methyltransferase [Actinopolymorpha pittospori]|uniref:SAM-dependent methyltransferase n=1 Tax=Actinopolymorpha pittospori TaxID=648752 RepID=A0A927N8R2_9ACTN|nr:class I SAM-dependent methyltransferase [Actinopolymorpha pittospori]MBE1613073.1 SAM-dependent methyltransferase [Actinopolymorpha pittospori]
MERAEIARLTEINRRAWDVIAVVRGDGLHPGDLFAEGVANLAAEELPISDWQGLDVLHLQCASGEDTLSLALVGAHVTGVDIAPQNIRHARRKAETAGLAARFVVADVYDLPPDLRAGTFDVVFVSCGALCWLPDLDRWAAIVASALKLGGRLLMDEIHPLNGCLRVDGGRLAAVDDYFRRGRPQWNAAGPSCLAGTGAGDVMPESVEFRWPLGDVVTAIARAGLRIELVEEYPSESPDGQAAEREVSRLPGGYVLLAAKDRESGQGASVSAR